MQSKTRWWILGTGGTAVVAVVATAGYLLLMPGPPSKYVTNSPVTDPQPLSANDVAHDYARSFGARGASAAAALTDDPTASTAALTTLYKNMSAARLTASVAVTPRTTRPP